VEQSSQGAVGVLLIKGECFCWTLEPDDKDPKKHQTLAGVYKFKRFSGTKWKNTFEIIVPGHTAVLFHSGNTEADTDMCVLLGSTPGKLKGNRAILNSGTTYEKFLEILKDVNEGYIEIVDSY